MTKIYLVSGDGIGAGKSTLAAKLGEVRSLAGAMRGELQGVYPQYNWFAKDQAYKRDTRIAEYGDGTKSMREVLIEYGQAKCKDDPGYWPRVLIEDLLQEAWDYERPVYAVDDVRKMVEVKVFRAAFNDVIHLHLSTDTAQHEPEFENEQLREIADYVVSWRGNTSSLHR